VLWWNFLSFKLDGSIEKHQKTKRRITHFWISESPTCQVNSLRVAPFPLETQTQGFDGMRQASFDGSQVFVIHHWANFQCLAG
jgi:hypothetical protein